MKKLIRFGVFVITLVSVQFVKAQTVDEVINSHIIALGGRENLDKITNIVMEGTLNYMGTEIMLTTTTVNNKLNRQDITAMGMTGFELLTVNEGWTYMPFLGMQKPVSKPTEEVKLNQSDLDVLGPLVDYAAKGHNAVLMEKENINGKTSYHILLTAASSKIINYYIDSASYLVNRLTETRNVNGQETEIQTDFADYKEVEGVKMAFSLTQQTGTIYISAIRVNQTIPESDYKPGL